MPEWFAKLGSKVVCDLLERWPSLKELQAVPPGKVKKFFRHRQGRQGELTERRMEGNSQAKPAIGDQAVVEAKRTVVQLIAQLLRTRREGIAVLDRKIAEAAEAYPDFFIFQSLPCWSFPRFRLLHQACSRPTLDQEKACFSQAPVLLDGLEVETQLGCQGTRCHVVCTAKRRQEVIKCVLVRDVNRRQLQAHFVLVPVEQIVVSYRHVEEAPWGDALRIVVVVLLVGCWNTNETRSELCAQTRVRKRLERCCVRTVTSEPGLELLVSGQGRSGNRIQESHIATRYVRVRTPICDRGCR